MDEKIMRVLIDMTNAFEHCAEFAVDEDQDKMNKAMAEAHEVIRFYHHVGAEEEEKAEQEYEVSKEECAGILGAMNDNHDATNGMNWDTIDYWLDELRLERENNTG